MCVAVLRMCTDVCVMITFKLSHSFSNLFPPCFSVEYDREQIRFETKASCHPHHSLLAFLNKSVLIIAQSVYSGWKSAGQGPLVLFYSL